MSIHRSKSYTSSTRRMEKPPIGEDLGKVLQSLPKGKVPGLDGLMMEFLLASWSFKQVDYLIMIKPFWEIGIFPQLAIGEIEGVNISEDLTICHRLFADDAGIFIPADEQSFKKLQDALKIYELASGAKLNLAKSVIVPLAMPSIPQ